MDLKNNINKRLLTMEQSAIRAFNGTAVKEGAKYFLTLGEPDFDTPNEIKEECYVALKKGMTKYGHTLGSIDFRNKICEFEKKLNGIDYTADEVVVTNGATEAITSAIFTIVNEGDEVIVPIPAFTLYESVIKFAGGKFVPLDFTKDDFQLTKEALDSVITEKTKAIIINSPNNPTGCMLNEQSLENLYNAVKGKDIFVICDDVYNQLVYGKKDVGFVKYRDIKDQIIVCQSFSKPYAMPGWRLGYLLASPEFCENASKVHQYMVTAVNTFIQPAGIVALSCDVTPFINSYKERRDYVLDRLNKMNLSVVKPEGAFYVFPSITEFNMTSYDFCYKFLVEKKVALIPGSCFGTEGNVRISYCVDRKVIEKAMDLLEEFVNELRTQK